MRDYGKVYTAFWTSNDVQGMSEDARTIAIYLLTCPHGNMLGCFRLPMAYVAEDLNWDAERANDAFNELSSSGYIMRCPKTQWTLITQYLKWNLFENPNVAKAAVKAYDALNAPEVMKMTMTKTFVEHGKHVLESEMARIRKVMEGYEKGLNNPLELSSYTRTYLTEPEPEPEPNQEEKTLVLKQETLGFPEIPELKKEFPDDFEEVWKAYPARHGANPKKDAFKQWKARVKEGVAKSEMFDGVKRYGDHLVAKGSVGTEFVMQAKRFLGNAKLYAEPWAISGPTSGAKQGAYNLQGIDYSGADKAMEESMKARGVEVPEGEIDF